MSASLTLLGRNMYGADPLISAEEQDALEEFMHTIERRIAEQVGFPVPIAGTALDSSMPGSPENLEELYEIATIGKSDGLARVQYATLRFALDGVLPEEWYDRYPEDFYESSTMMRDEEVRQRAGRYRHLIDHNPVDGFYIPIDFPDPIWIDSSPFLDDRAIAVGSANRLRREIDLWFSEIAPIAGENAGFFIFTMKGLSHLVDAALAGPAVVWL